MALLAALAASFAWSGCALALPPGEASATAAVRDIVLVHGAFTDGSIWSPVVQRLQRKGYRVTAVQNPLTSLADDVAATRRVLARQRGPVILVGHSWAGAVITEAGDTGNVKGLVYLSALVPDQGESVSDLLARLQSPMEGLQTDAQGFVWLDDPQAYRTVLAGDVAMDQVSVLAASQQPIAASAFTAPVTHAAWRSKPSWYLVTTQDRALAPTVQRRLASAINARTRSVAASHLALVSQPAAVADFIDAAARAVAP